MVGELLLTGGNSVAGASTPGEVLEGDHARLKARLRLMRGLKQVGSAARMTVGHSFVQNLRRGHYDLAIDALRRILRARIGRVTGCFLHTRRLPHQVGTPQPR